MPREDEIDLQKLTNEELAAIALRTLKEIYSFGKTHTPLEVGLVDAVCALLPNGSKGVNPQTLFTELQRRQADRISW